MYKRFKNEGRNIEGQRGGDQMSKDDQISPGQEHTAAIEEALYESRAYKGSVCQDWYFTCNVLQNYDPNTEDAEPEWNMCPPWIYSRRVGNVCGVFHVPFAEPYETKKQRLEHAVIIDEEWFSRKDGVVLEKIELGSSVE